MVASPQSNQLFHPHQKYLNSKLFKLRKLEYETGKIALRYQKTAERNAKFNYEQAMSSLVQVYIKKKEEIERLPDELTGEELRSLE